VVRRDPDGPQLCRAICGAGRDDDEAIEFRPRSLDTLRAHHGSKKLSRAQTLRGLSKRTLRQPRRIEDLMVNHFKKMDTFHLEQVYDDATGKHNSAVFKVLGTKQFELGLKELCGCTAVVVVSEGAVWFAHFL
jgi:hypothetical protein